MAARGSYAKGIAKRDEILTTALEVIAANGYRKTTIRELAAAVHLSQTGLLHYFGTKEDLFIEVLRKRDEVDSAMFGVRFGQIDAAANIIDVFTRVIQHNTEVPGLVHLYTQFASEASEPGHPAHQYFRERSERFKSTLAGAIRAQQDNGTLADSVDADRVATLLMSASDGLQVQWLLDPSVDMISHISLLWASLTRP